MGWDVILLITVRVAKITALRQVIKVRKPPPPHTLLNLPLL